jgi:curved DNA-binding protein CbpA
MMVINAAYTILKNINLRILYDKQRRKGLTGMGAGIKENSVTVEEGAPSSATKSTPKPRNQPSRPTEQPSSASRRKYSYGSGFGGSWSYPAEEESR